MLHRSTQQPQCNKVGKCNNQQNVAVDTLKHNVDRIIHDRVFYRHDGRRQSTTVHGSHSSLVAWVTTRVFSHNPNISWHRVANYTYYVAGITPCTCVTRFITKTVSNTLKLSRLFLLWLFLSCKGWFHLGELGLFRKNYFFETDQTLYKSASGRNCQHWFAVCQQTSKIYVHDSDILRVT